MPERVKKTKCRGGGGLREKFEGGGYAVEGKEDEMQGGLPEKFEGSGYAVEGKEDEMRGGGGG